MTEDVIAFPLNLLEFILEMKPLLSLEYHPQCIEQIKHMFILATEWSMISNCAGC